MKKLIAIIALTLLAPAASARILNVPSEYATIQAGIDASINGDTVLVGPGRYVEELTIGSNIILTSSGGPDATIIQGTCRFEGVDIDSTCVLRGFSFADGDDFHPYLMIVFGASPKIEGNVIQGKFWTSMGGAISCSRGNPIIRGNIINNNHATFSGGGLCFEVSSPPYTSHAEISYNIISNNRASAAYASGHGGGIYLLGDATIKYNLIYDNQAYCYNVSGGVGGGIYKGGSSSAHRTVIENNTIVNNAALYRTDPSVGAGIYARYVQSMDTLIVRNNIFAFNSRGGNVWINPNDPVTFGWDYNLLYGDTTSIFPHGDHDNFLDPLLADTSTDDYHLLPGSPCIDSGDPASPLDPDSTRADIGALFFSHAVDIDNPGDPAGPFAFELHQNYPNPFNGETIISYDLPQTSVVSLRIYDLTGRVVKVLARSESQAAGPHHVVWDGTNGAGRPVATAIYLYELTVDGQKAAKAMIFLR